jgi:hypothetical protein
MAGVQLDKNSDAKKLFLSCNAQGLVTCFRLPRSLRDEGDDKVLAHAISRDRVLLTYDRTIITEFWQVVAGGCPGVVILAQDDHGPFTRQMTYPAAVKILANFKQDFPQWHAVSWDNSIVEILPSFICVNHVEPTGVTRTPGGFLTRSVVGWQAELQGLLQLNASRS